MIESLDKLSITVLQSVGSTISSALQQSGWSTSPELLEGTFAIVVDAAYPWAPYGGWSFAAKVRATDPHVPIIFVSETCNLEDRMRAFSFDACGIVQPHQTDILCAMLARILKRRELQLRPLNSRQEMAYGAFADLSKQLYYPCPDKALEFRTDHWLLLSAVLRGARTTLQAGHLVQHQFSSVDYTVNTFIDRYGNCLEAGPTGGLTRDLHWTKRLPDGSWCTRNPKCPVYIAERFRE